MSKRKVIVVSKHNLLREGLRRVLSRSQSIELLGVVETLAEAEELSTVSPADVIITDRDIPLEKEKLTILMEMTKSQVVTITVEDRDMMVYSQKRIPDATIQNLFEVLQDSQ